MIEIKFKENINEINLFIYDIIIFLLIYFEF